MKLSAYLITAIGTPLESDERLHEPGLEQHLEDQWSAGINGVLVAGSMGLMQMLRDETYLKLVRRSVEISRGRGEILVGVGDASWVRTRDRIEAVCKNRIDGIVAVAPYFFRFSQEQMVDYFRTIADYSPVPLYLYDLPARTGVELDLGTYEALIQHPNIRGAKISGRIDVARELTGRFGDTFRIIVAEPQMIVELLGQGMVQHLDGIFAVAPRWFTALARSAKDGDWEAAQNHQQRINNLLDLLRSSRSVFGCFTALMNARGISGRFHAAPGPPLNADEQTALFGADIVQDLLASEGR
jgi:4-hydroxy-tetrahydrodipicolinate synthase